MKKSTYLLALALGASTLTFAQNIGINTDGSAPDSDAILHINNHSGSSADSSIIRIENEQNGANDVTGLELYNSGTGATAKWDMYIPASGSTDLRINNNGSDHVTIQNDGDVGIGTTSPVSTLDINGSVGYAVTTITSATTLNNTQNVVLCNTGPYTVNLPAAADNTGRIYYIKNIDVDGDDITVDGNATETIDGSATYVLDAYLRNIKIISDGSNWHVIGHVNNVGTVASITCNSITDNGTLSDGVAASGVSSDVPYTGGNGGSYAGEAVTSTGVTGLTATLTSGSFDNGSGTVTYDITGTPASSGIASFDLNFGGQSCTITRSVSATIPGNATCTGATISATPCSAVANTTLNDDGTTADGTEFDWADATTSGAANTTTTRALVDIGGQCWMRYNMAATPTAFNPSPTWNGTEQGTWGVNPVGTGNNLGNLYQWTAAMNGSTTERAQGVCPNGFHIPSDCEWMYLENTLGMSIAAQQTIGSRTSGNVDQDLTNFMPSATNSSGFSGEVSGRRRDNGVYFEGSTIAGWWHSSSVSGLRMVWTGAAGFQRNGASRQEHAVRCVAN